MAKEFFDFEKDPFERDGDSAIVAPEYQDFIQRIQKYKDLTKPFPHAEDKNREQRSIEMLKDMGYTK